MRPSNILNVIHILWSNQRIVCRSTIECEATSQSTPKGSNQKSTIKMATITVLNETMVSSYTPPLEKNDTIERSWSEPIIIAIKSFCLVIEREIAAYKNQFKC